MPLAPLVADCLQMMRPAAQARGIALHVSPMGADVTVLAGRKRLRQVLLNLLSNAVKYNRDDGARCG
jgi:signal transduction histidine kinase